MSIRSISYISNMCLNIHIHPIDNFKIIAFCRIFSYLFITFESKNLKNPQYLQYKNESQNVLVSA